MSLKRYLLGALITAALSACPGEKKTDPPKDKPTPETPKPDPKADTMKADTKPTTAAAGATSASGKIESKSGSTVTGEITFTQNGDKLDVVMKVSGATPGEHAVHVHEKGDCSDPEAKNAGGHFNPKGMDHGSPTAEKHHPGDFGNLTVAADGTGTLTLSVGELTIADGPMSVVGKAVVFHEKADDFKTQPTGNAGGRQGCAVIAAK